MFFFGTASLTTVTTEAKNSSKTFPWLVAATGEDADYDVATHSQPGVRGTRNCILARTIMKR